MKKYRVLFIDSTVVVVEARNKKEAGTKAVAIKQMPVYSVSAIRD